MSKDEKYTKSRRNILKGVAIGAPGAVVATQQWQKPILDSVVLPTHAATTPSATLICAIDWHDDSGADKSSDITWASSQTINKDDWKDFSDAGDDGKGADVDDVNGR